MSSVNKVNRLVAKMIGFIFLFAGALSPSIADSQRTGVINEAHEGRVLVGELVTIFNQMKSTALDEDGYPQVMDIKIDLNPKSN